MLTVFPYDTYSSNQESSVIDTTGMLGIKLVATTGELSGSALIMRIWPCDAEGTLGTPMIGARTIYPDTTVTVIGVQPGTVDSAAEPVTSVYAVTISAALPPFIKILTAREDVVDLTYGVEATLF